MFCISECREGNKGEESGEREKKSYSEHREGLFLVDALFTLNFSWAKSKDMNDMCSPACVPLFMHVYVT